MEASLSLQQSGWQDGRQNACAATQGCDDCRDGLLAPFERALTRKEAMTRPTRTVLALSRVWGASKAQPAPIRSEKAADVAT